MKIFIPGDKDPNPYLDEIIKYSSHEFIFDDLENYQEDFSIVNIHWPEALFSWRMPTQSDLRKLETKIQVWKNKSLIVYTRHDSSSHLGTDPVLKDLFSIIEENADAFIHLGNYSKLEMEKKFPLKPHAVIGHPLYSNSFQIFPKAVARKKMGISPTSLVIIAPGKIRNSKEREFLLSVFESLKSKDKVLISNNMLPFYFFKDFRGRLRLKKYFDVNKFVLNRINRKYRPPKFLFNYGYSSPEELSVMMSASDLVFIPRLDILNSGNIFLGLTFKKIIVGPSIGNMEEILKTFKFPLFNPKSRKSAKIAITNGIKMLDQVGKIYSEKEMGGMMSESISLKMDKFFNKLLE